MDRRRNEGRTERVPPERTSPAARGVAWQGLARAGLLWATALVGGCAYTTTVDLPMPDAAPGGPTVIDSRPSRQQRYGNWQYDLEDCHFVAFPVAEAATQPPRMDYLRAMLPARLGPSGANARVEIVRFDLYANRGWAIFNQSGTSGFYANTGSTTLDVLLYMGIPGPRRTAPDVFGCAFSRTGEFRRNEAPEDATPMVGYLDAAVNGQAVRSRAIHVPMRADGSMASDIFDSRQDWDAAVRGIVDATIEAFVRAARPALGLAAPSRACPLAPARLPPADH